MSYNEMQDYVKIRNFQSPIIKYSYFFRLKKEYLFLFSEEADLFVKPFKGSTDTWDFKLKLFVKDFDYCNFEIRKEPNSRLDLTIESHGELVTLYKCFPCSSRQVKTPDHMYNYLIVEGFIQTYGYRYQRADYKNQKIVTYDIDFLQDYKSDNHRTRSIK